MRKSRFTDEQIIGMIKEREAGLPTSERCRKHGLSPATSCKLKRLLARCEARQLGSEGSLGKALTTPMAQCCGRRGCIRSLNSVPAY